MVTWCEENNLTLNTDKTMETIVEMRKENSLAADHLWAGGGEGEQLQIPGHLHQ